MKNKLCYILLGVFVCFAFVGNAFAAELDFILTATPDATTVVKGNEVTITLNLKSDSPIEYCDFQVASDSTLEYIDMNESNLWHVDIKQISHFTIANDVYKTDPLTNGQDILQIKYKVNGDGKVTIKTNECSYADEENKLLGTHEDVVIDVTSKDKGEDYTLSNLEVINGELLTPITTPSNVPYAIALDSSTFGLKATASNEDYNDKIVFKDVNGNVINDPLNITYAYDAEGDNKMTITVTVNEQKTYNLYVVYEQKEMDNSLKLIKINGIELPLTVGQSDYYYTVGKDVTSFDVVVELSDATNFKFGDGSNFDGASFTFNSDGFAYVNIEVVPVNSSIGADSVLYTVIVTREGNVSVPPADDTQKDDDSSGETTGGGSSGDVTSNPDTGEISKFLMAVILIASLVGSIIIYQKNLQSYK